MRRRLTISFTFAAGRPFTRVLLLKWRASMEKQLPSTINIRLSAMRNLVAEARRSGGLSSEEAAILTEIPNIKQAATQLGNWLTREQAKELLAVPDHSTRKGKRNYVRFPFAVLGYDLSTIAVGRIITVPAIHQTDGAALDIACLVSYGRWLQAQRGRIGSRQGVVEEPEVLQRNESLFSSKPFTVPHQTVFIIHAQKRSEMSPQNLKGNIGLEIDTLGLAPSDFKQAVRDAVTV